jgi:hypothetical protein
MTRSVESALKWESARSPRLQGRASRERRSAAGAGKWTNGLEKKVLMLPSSGRAVAFGSARRAPVGGQTIMRTPSKRDAVGACKRVYRYGSANERSPGCFNYQCCVSVARNDTINEADSSPHGANEAVQGEEAKIEALALQDRPGLWYFNEM